MTWIVLAAPLLLGLCLVSIFFHERSALSEKLALAFSTGLGALTVLMFLLAHSRIPLTLRSILSALFLSAGLLSVSLIKMMRFCLSRDDLKVLFDLKRLRLSLMEALLGLLIGFKLVFAFYSALIKPLVDIDAIQFYAVVAKGIFVDKTFLTPYLRQFMGDKPPLPYLLQGWAFIGQNSLDDAWMKLVYPCLFAGLIAIFYSALRRYFPRIFCLLFTFLLSGLPFLLYHAGTAYADLTMTFYFAAGTIYLFLFMKEFGRGDKGRAFSDLPIALLLLGLCVWVKRAGLVLAGMDLLVLGSFLLSSRAALSRDDRARALRALALFAAVVAPWLCQGQVATLARILFSIAGPTSGDTIVAAVRVHSPPSLARTGEILRIFARNSLLHGNWQLLWALFAAALAFFPRRCLSKPLSYLLAMILLGLAALLVQFESGEMFQWLSDGTLLDRLVMNFAPVALFFCAEAALPSLLETPAGSGSRPRATDRCP